MAKLRIKKYVNQVKNSKMFGKWYGRVNYNETLSTDDLCRHISKHGTIYTSDVVKGVIERFVLCFEELLHEGYKIKLDGLGTFSLKMSTSGARSAEEFGVQNIRHLQVKFNGDKKKFSEYASPTFMKNARFEIEPDASEKEKEKGENED